MGDLGNVSKTGTLSFTPTYNNATNQISSVGGQNYSYDANGNLLSTGTGIGTNTYSWNSYGAMTGDRPNGSPSSAMTVLYDALGRPAFWYTGSTCTGTTCTTAVYGPDGSKLALMNGQTLSRARIAAPGGGLDLYGPSATLVRYWHSDWQGSMRLVTNPTRTFYSSTAYAPYGETYASSPNSFVPDFASLFGDTSSEIDDATFRRYSPTQSRWLSPDPAGLGAMDPANPQSLNRYAYVGNNPTTRIDPSGLCPGQSNCPHPTSCLTIGCADNPATYCASLYCGYDPTGLITGPGWDEFGLQNIPVVVQVGWGYTPVFGGAWVPGPSGSDYASRMQLWGYWGPIYEQTGDAFTILGEPSASLTGPIPISTTSSKMKPVIGYSATVVLPIFYGLGPALTVSSVPSQNLACIAPGIGASVGRTLSFGPIVGDSENVRNVLEGVSFSGGYQFAPWAGAGGSVNYSGAVSGNTFGVPGASATLTYGFCSGL